MMTNEEDTNNSDLSEQYIGFLKNGICTVTFTKVNGDTRVMKCTLNTSFIPSVQIPQNITEQEVESANSSNVIRVFDLEALGWRSFRVDSVTDFTPGV